MVSRVIFCGFDNSGKSSIVRALSLATGIPSFKDSTYRETEYFGSWNYSNITGKILLEFIHQTRMGAILDRFVAPCEYAYGNSLRDPVDFEKLKHFDLRLAEMGFRFVYCYKTKYLEFEDSKVKFSDFLSIHNWYKEYFKQSQCNHLILDTTDEDIKQQLVDIKLFLT